MAPPVVKITNIKGDGANININQQTIPVNVYTPDPANTSLKIRIDKLNSDGEIIGSGEPKINGGEPGVIPSGAGGADLPTELFANGFDHNIVVTATDQDGNSTTYTVKVKANSRSFSVPKNTDSEGRPTNQTGCSAVGVLG